MSDNPVGLTSTVSLFITYETRKQSSKKMSTKVKGLTHLLDDNRTPEVENFIDGDRLGVRELLQTTGIHHLPDLLVELIVNRLAEIGVSLRDLSGSARRVVAVFEHTASTKDADSRRGFLYR